MACAAKDVSGVRGTDVFVTAGRIVETQSLKIGWRVGAVADAVHKGVSAPRTFGLFVPVPPPNATAEGGRACSNTMSKACWLNKQKGLRVFRMHLMDAAASRKGVIRSIISLALPNTGGGHSYMGCLWRRHRITVAHREHPSQWSQKIMLYRTSMYLQLPSC